MKLPSLEDYEIAIDTEQLIKAAELKDKKLLRILPCKIFHLS